MIKIMLSKDALQVIAAAILFVLIAATSLSHNSAQKTEAQKRQLAHSKK